MKRLDPVIRLMAAVKCITERFKRDNLNEYAAYSALFIVLSFVPFLMLILTIINKFPIFSDAGAYDINLFSDDVTAFFQQILAETEQKATGALLSVSTIVALWSASRALIGIINGLNRIHRVKETRGFLRLRIAAVFYMIFFIVAVLIMLILLVFGQAILDEETQKLVKLEQSVKVLEKHKEKQHEAYLEEEKAQELKQFSEIGVQRFFIQSRENQEEAEALEKM